MDGTMNDTTTRAVMLAVAVVLTFANAATSAAHAQRPTTRRTATSAERKRTSDDARMRGFSLGAYTVAAPGLTVTGNDLDGSVKTSFGPGAGIMSRFGNPRVKMPR